MISTKDCTVMTGNVQSRHGEKHALFEQFVPFASTNSSKAKSPNLPNQLWLNSTMEEKCPPVSCFHMAYAKMKSMPVHGFAKLVPGDDDCSRTNIPGSESASSIEAADMDHKDAIVAACHLLLLSNSLQSQQRACDSYAEQMLRHEYMKRLRDPFEEDSDSFTPTSLTSGVSPSSNDCRSSGSGSHNNMGTETSSLVTDSEVTSDSNAPARKRKKATGRLLADIVGQERESEVLDRPARKRRYRSLADLLASSTALH
ncbi:hypothetical protein MPTK1_7g12260 [Marchantia polymorpha subsp. ruderalis]|uniref:Uncharacterized protein n=2 Tax=Marchantia polymorpha TaxID=3197 RepID=A0AAF6BYP9_MARPO|nr:hypothetical protein MARPO_0889s0002 [Marchantia polymorpha]BBN17133.1 hypothetical protein Mp_7g12260 [Marchantia polymorpha subsp. ruderalis]|eukprot:PTQ26598.1 hypothetical protein MARPO_0889s0002 [Marchantia polymorpha]